MIPPAQQQAILETVRQGATPRWAFQANGISDQTLYSWRAIAQGADTWPGTTSPVDDASRAAIVEFVERLGQAQAECYSALATNLYRNATTINPKTGWVDTQAADRILSKSPGSRGDWHEERHLQVEHSGPNPAEQWALAATDQELYDALPAEYRELVELPAPQAPDSEPPSA